VAAGGRDVARIAGIIGADRPVRLGSDRLGAGDDAGERRPQRLVEPLAERARIGVERRRAGRNRGSGGQSGGGAPEAGEAADAIDQRDSGEPVAPAAAAAQLGELAVEAALLGQGGEQGQLALLAFLEPEQMGELAADQLCRRPAGGGGGGGRDNGEPKPGVRLPHPVGRGAQEVCLAFGVGSGCGIAGGADGPPGDGQGHAVLAGLGANPQIESPIPLGRDRAARDDDSEPPRKAGERGDLRHCERPAFLPAGGAVQRHQPRLGLDQPSFGVEPAADLVRRAHAASLATAAR
jgi:hypothetical protein